MLLVPVLIATPAAPVAAQTQAIAGAASEDQGNQALAFLPNELWVHAGDNITWTFPTDEIHTVTFLRTSPSPQIRPPFAVGCPGGPTPSGSSYPGGTTCLDSGLLLGGTTYTVQFPATGNFKLVCLVHANMTGVVHVLDPSETLPHDQAFYDRQAQTERAELLSDAAALVGRGHAIARRTSENEVTAGIGDIVATTGGGSQTASVMRFLQRKIVVNVGDTVEWTNLDPVTNHTVTFGVEPSDPMSPPSATVTTDSDGALHALIASSSDSVHSGLLGAARQDRVNLPQTPLGVTRFRITFTIPGTFDYICALHDDLGMVGTVVVHP
jgi:plastocyanin